MSGISYHVVIKFWLPTHLGVHNQFYTHQQHLYLEIEFMIYGHKPCMNNNLYWKTTSSKSGLDVMQSHLLQRTWFGQYQASSAVLESCTPTLHDGSTTTCELVYCNLCGGFSTDTKCALQQVQCWLRTGGSITDRYLTHIAFILMVQCCMMSGGSTHNVHTQITAYEFHHKYKYVCTTEHGVSTIILGYTLNLTINWNWNKNKIWPTSVLQ